MVCILPTPMLGVQPQASIGAIGLGANGGPRHPGILPTGHSATVLQ